MDKDFAEILHQFMGSPLVTWVKTFESFVEGSCDITTPYMEIHPGLADTQQGFLRLVDGVFLNEVMRLIDPNPKNQLLYYSEQSDDSPRMQNLSVLRQHLRTYYQENLQQLVLMPFPDINLLARDPFTEQGIEEMRRFLLLLLGCAVQCERREELIDRIQALTFETQAVIASCIQEVTQNQSNILLLQWSDLGEMERPDLELIFQNMVHHLKRLVKEQEESAERVSELETELFYAQQLPPSLLTSKEPLCLPANCESWQHLTVQLADTRARLRRTRQELEEKGEQLLDYQQEILDFEAELKKLRQENRDLSHEARLAHIYRDDLDVLREKVNRVDKLHNELRSYKERLHSLELYRGKLEEEKEYSQALLETKLVLEEQLEAARSRCDKLHEMEKENIFLRSRLCDLELERDSDRLKVEELLRENLTLEVELKQSLGESIHHDWEEELEPEIPVGDPEELKPLSSEVHEVLSGHLLNLERENQELRLRAQILQEKLESRDGETTSVAVQALEQENRSLRKSVERLQTDLNLERESSQRAEELGSSLMTEKERLQRTLKMLQEQASHEAKELKQENANLNRTLESLRQRSQVGMDARIKDLEQENKILHDTVLESSSKASQLEHEKRQLQQEVEELRDRAAAGKEAEKDLRHLECQHQQLQRKVLEQEMAGEKVRILEETVSELEGRNNSLKRSLEGLKGVTQQLELLEEENLLLRKTVEQQKLESTLMRQLEYENQELEKERKSLKRTVEALRASARKEEDLEMKLQSLQAENQRMQKLLENGRRKVDEMEAEQQESEKEAQNLKKQLEEKRLSIRQLEQDKETLEVTLGQTERDKKQLEKEHRRLRQQVEVAETQLDQQSLRMVSLEQQGRLLSLEVARLKEGCSQVKEMQQERTELQQQAAVDRKALITLQEELLTEKVRVQEQEMSLTQLREKLEQKEQRPILELQDQDRLSDSSFRSLEQRLESSFKIMLEMKEDQIRGLREQLEELLNMNQKQTQEMQRVKQSQENQKLKTEALPRFQPEEEMGHVHNNKPEAGKEEELGMRRDEEETGVRIDERETLGARLITVERSNAALAAEKQALTTQLQQLESHLGNLQTQILTLQKQGLCLQEQSGGLKAVSTRLQAENTSLSSQNTSLVVQVAQLKAQLGTLEGEARVTLQEHEEMRGRYDSLLKDHERLVLLHERQEADMEGLMEKQSKLKGALRSLELEHRELQGRHSQLLMQKAHLEELEVALKVEQERLERDGRRQRALEEDCLRLQEEQDRLKKALGDSGQEQEELLAQVKALKSQLNSLQLEKTRLEAECSGTKEQNQQLDISMTKLSNQCELLAQLKGNLEEENRHLLHQIQILTQENRALMEKTMESKDQFHEEQRQYMDKLNELRREKQKLVEKIMDQYRVLEPTIPKSKKSNWITDKMKKLIKPRREGARDRLRAPAPGAGSTENLIVLLHQDGLQEPPGEGREADRSGFQAPGFSAPSSPTFLRRASSSVSILDSHRVHMRLHRRKLSSRLTSSESFSPGDSQTSPRERFRQRRIGWYERPRDGSEDETHGREKPALQLHRPASEGNGDLREKVLPEECYGKEIIDTASTSSSEGLSLMEEKTSVSKTVSG
ncbi:coiled-coil domain-containing protein 88B [Rhinatrema bivittatum]|uniref:coiled-coil domain-containing protein 88B n=1 Tax=Rhinatrema bivittatum TaxID=194408 RepID=UPI00112E0157|nr:coiled-coil domain-containing protein 88B [Rhinatrema bivittatum]